jgi:hypothetical protein
VRGLDNIVKEERTRNCSEKRGKKVQKVGIKRQGDNRGSYVKRRGRYEAKGWGRKQQKKTKMEV